MSESRLPPPSPEQRRIAAERFDRARQVILTGNQDYGVQLLLACCKLDPANLIYRQELRKAQKKKFKNNMRGGAFSFLTTARARSRLRKANKSGNYEKVLEHGEEILTKNPWDRGAQLEMGLAADSLGLTDVAIFILDQARQKDSKDPVVNRALARVLEKRGHFAQAIKVWEQVRQAVPTDVEAAGKAKDLAASETIKRGHYEDAVTSDDPIRAVMQHNAQLAAERDSKGELKLKEKLEADPTDPQHYLNLAVSLRRAGKLDEAVQLLQNGLATTGNDFRLQLELTELEIEPFRKNLAIADEKLKTHPDDEDLRKLRMRLMKEVNARELDVYRLKADRNPGELQHRLELGLRLLRAGRIDEAITELQISRKDDRLYAKSALYLGHCFKARQNWRLAQRNFEEALEKLPAADEANRKDILYQLATGTAESGDLAKAIDVANELANLDFAYRDISTLLDQWHAKLQKA